MKIFILIVYCNVILLSIEVVLANKKHSAAPNNTSNIDFKSILSKFIASFTQSSNSSIDNKYREDIHLPFAQLVKKYGYKVEEHEAKTSDGYLLTMFRIPKKGPAVLLIHGLTLSSDDFVTIGPQAGLAYQLANAGYDVWLGNCRGNKHSLRHAILPTASAAYWDFSWDEMGRHDMPALIDYILNATNETKLKVIGHSQGTNVILVLCSEKPEYNDKISVAILLSPTIFMSHVTAPFLRILAGPLTPDVYLLGKSLGLYSLFTDREIGPVNEASTNLLCATPETAEAFCSNILFTLFGPDREQINATSLPVIFGHFPTSISIKMVQHFVQLIKSGKFRQYDSGKALNLLKYGSAEPPEYHLEKVTTKIAIFWAENDWACAKEDLQIVLDKLHNVIEMYTVPHKEFNHFDYIFARDVKTLLYDKVLETLKSN